MAARASRVALRVHRGRIAFDFRASDDQLENGANATRAVTLSAVFYVLRLFLPAYAPTNAGILRRAEVLTRPGSLADARYPAPVAAGNVETSQRLVDLLLGALAPLVPDSVPAASSGTMSNLTLGGTRADGTSFTYYETLAGGAGGSPAGPGRPRPAHAHDQHAQHADRGLRGALSGARRSLHRAPRIRRSGRAPGRRRPGEAPARSSRPPTWPGSPTASARGPGVWPAETGELRAARASCAAPDAPKSCRAASAASAAPGDRIELATPGGGGHGPGRTPAARAGAQKALVSAARRGENRQNSRSALTRASRAPKSRDPRLPRPTSIHARRLRLRCPVGRRGQGQDHRPPGARRGRRRALPGRRERRAHGRRRRRRSTSCT